MKKCTKCELEKMENEFPKNKRYKSGLDSICKSCKNNINKAYRENNKSSFLDARKKYYQNNIDKMRVSKREYYKLHVEEKKQYDVLYREKNKEKIKQYKKDWEALNKDNPIFKIKRTLRTRVRNALKSVSKTDKTFSLICCTPSKFKTHIEKQFATGMSWDNYGEWHIDHIIPCFTFNLLLEEEQKKCFHYSNQRPLWAKDNLSRVRSIW